MNDLGIRAAAAAFLLVVAIVPLLIHLCFRWQILDPPGPLKIHKRPVPRLGGIALVIAISAALLFVSPHLFARHWLLFLALAIIWIAGVCDDVWRLSAMSRFAAQGLAASILWFGGWQLAPGLPIFSFAATVLWIVLFVNAFNFLDGADGLASGTVCIVALGFALTIGPHAAAMNSLIACAVAGSCAAFLIFNLSGKIHLGDGGSTSLGFLIAALGLTASGVSSQAPGVSLFILVAAALPLLDCAFAVVRRLRKGQSPLQGDRRHFYDCFQARGWSSLRVALACLLCTAALTIAASFASRLSRPRNWLISVASLGIPAIILCKVGILGSEKAAPASAKEMDTGCSAGCLDNR